MPPLRSDAVLERLTRLHPKLIDLSLERIERLLAALGHPERELPPVVHVAGTNGKGSVIAFLKAICEAAGLSAHVYVSPHLIRFNERIGVRGRPIGEEPLNEALAACEEANAGAPITFFEITTAAAFLAFSRVPADIALIETGRIKPGDTVVISAAAGSVGQIAGQIAKICGCRAIAVTSTEEKLAWCREIGYDDGIAYRNEPDLAAAIARVCPDGVDVYYDNTAGPILDAVFQNLATHARIVVVGTISLADRFEQPDIGPRFMRRILVARARIEGFLSGDYAHRSAEAYERLAAWQRAGLLRSRFDIAEGFESLPGAFLRLLTSKNVGKQVVRVAEPSTPSEGTAP